MSTGHHHKHLHHPDLVSEIERLLDSDPVKQYMRRRFSVDKSYKIPLTGGSSLNGRVYYIDRDLPAVYQPYVILHERVEKALRDVMHMSYDRAHSLATAAERIKVEQSGRDWDSYKKRIGQVVKENEKQKPHKMPEGFDTGPYKESGLMHLLAT